MTNDEILDFHYEFQDCHAKNLREYFYRLLMTLWSEGEEFSGKRPFGNSVWEFDIYKALVAMDVIKGSFDEDGYLSYCDKQAGYELVEKLIDHIFVGVLIK